MAEPGDEIAAGADGGSRLIASQADREQVLDALKAAFVQGRLTKRSRGKVNNHGRRGGRPSQR
jgi:hypothetical protein